MPKPQLVQARQDAGLTQYELAERVNEELRRQNRRDSCTSQDISRLETGQVGNPRDPAKARAICVVLKTTPAALGFSAESVQAVREPTPAEAARATMASRLAAHATRPQAEIRALSIARGVVKQSISRALDPEVVMRVIRQPRRTTSTDRRSVDVMEQRLRELRHFDDFSGSGAVYHSALADLDLLAHVMQRCETGPSYARCAALAAQALTFCAFAAYDRCDVAGAREHMLEAERLLDNVPHALKIHVYAYRAWYEAIQGRRDEAMTLASKVLVLTNQGRLEHRTAAWAFVMAARVYALLGNSNEARPLIMRAEERFSRCEVPPPDWIHYFDEARLLAYIGICYGDLGDREEAIDYLRRALDSMNPDYHRARARYHVRLALLLGEAGRHVEALGQATAARECADHTSSPSVASALAELEEAISQWNS